MGAGERTVVVGLSGLVSGQWRLVEEGTLVSNRLASTLLTGWLVGESVWAVVRAARSGPRAQLAPGIKSFDDNDDDSMVLIDPLECLTGSCAMFKEELNEEKAQENSLQTSSTPHPRGVFTGKANPLLSPSLRNAYFPRCLHQDKSWNATGKN